AYGMPHALQTVSTYFTYRRLARTIDGIGVYREGEANVANASGVADPHRVTSATISATLLPVLGVTPIVGRSFAEADDRRGAARVALISESLFRTRFAADRAVVGRVLDVNGISREVVGVLPAGFHFPGETTDLWIPSQLDPDQPGGAGFEYAAIARLKPRVTLTEALRYFAALLPGARALLPKFVPGISTAPIMDQVRPTPVLIPLRDDLTSGIAATLWMVFAAAMLVLGVASANVLNLTLVRADARRR